MADGTQWFYMRGNDRVGPVADGEIKGLFAAGRIAPRDLVWSQGMAEWTPAGAVFSGGSVSAVPIAPGAPPGLMVNVGYYMHAMGMPQRAADMLKGHAGPTGDTGDWPLNDQHIAAFREAMQTRKKIVTASRLYRALMVLSVLGCIAVAFVFIVAAATAKGPRNRNALPVAAVGGSLALVVGFAVLYHFAAKGTERSQRWAPLTVFVVMIVSLVGNFASMAVRTSPAAAGAGITGGIVGALFAGIFAFVSWQAYSAIPKYLATPAWCQELGAIANEVERERGGFRLA